MSDANRRPELVVEALAGNDEPLRLVAIRLVRETKDPQLVRACMKQWKSLGPDAQVLLVDILADRGDRDSLPDIVEACKSSDISVRIAAIDALAEMGDARPFRSWPHRAAVRRSRAGRRTPGLAVLPGPDIQRRTGRRDFDQYARPASS